MNKGFIDELRWRGMLASISAGAEAELNKGEMKTAYIGTDPTAKSLHVGHLCAFMMARLFQKYGGKPIILVGDATASIGDPSFKSSERNLMTNEEVMSNAENIRKQLSKVVTFNSGAENDAIMVGNNDWMKNYSFMDFAREVGKYITVNYMMAKDSVKMRLEREGEGMSFLEFTYQLIQGNDFKHLFQTYNCQFQFAGNDQVGNATTGVELVRKTLGKDVYYVTCPLVCDSNGKKFGKSEGNAIWLDKEMTTPYQMYQYFMNLSDELAEVGIKIFCMFSKEDTFKYIEEHKAAPHKRLLQSLIAKEVITMLHGEDEYNKAVTASQIMFGGGSVETLKTMDESTLLSALDGVKKVEVSIKDIEKGIPLIDLVVGSGTIKSKNEYRKLLGGVYLNQEKITDVNVNASMGDLLNNKYLLFRQGKKNYTLMVAQ